MPIIGFVTLMAGLVLVYLGFTGGTIGQLTRTVFGK